MGSGQALTPRFAARQRRVNFSACPPQAGSRATSQSSTAPGCGGAATAAPGMTPISRGPTSSIPSPLSEVTPRRGRCLTRQAEGYILIAKDLQVGGGAIMAETSLIQELRGAGLKATSARRAVIRVLEERRAHLSAEDIHQALAASGARVDLSSVYRTLTLLVRLGLVRPAGPAERHGHFEMEHEERVHFLCARCGGVTEVRLPRRAEVQRAMQGLARSNRFALAKFTIEATGECEACRRSGNGSRRRTGKTRMPSAGTAAGRDRR